MTLRILFAVHGAADPHTAVFQNVTARAAYLRSAGHTVEILSPADFPRLRWPRLQPLLLPLALARRVSAFDVAVFHSYIGWAFHAARRWLDPRRQTTTITAFHGLEPLYSEALTAELAQAGTPASIRFRLMQRGVMPRLLAATCRASDAVFCLNSAEAEFLTRSRWVDPGRLTIVENGIEPALLEPRTYSPAARRLVFLGQWLPAKGIRYLVSAFAGLAARRDVELACVGTGTSAAGVLAAFPPAVRARVTVHPRVDRAGVSAQLRRGDLFVFPTLSEGSSAALLEAMASGLPIVTTPAGFARDILEHGRDALLVPMADAAALESAIDSLLDDAGQRRRLGEAAQRRAAGCLWDTVNERYAAQVLKAVGDGRR